eukprot:11172703-Lingulodinium_polyedra.AAC.1
MPARPARKRLALRDPAYCRGHDGHGRTPPGGFPGRDRRPTIRGELRFSNGRHCGRGLRSLAPNLL